MEINNRYSVDNIIDNIVLLENIDTNKKIEVSINLLPNDIKEGNILIFKNNKYLIDEKVYNERKNRILNKLERLKRLKKN